jgi:hypothetical protein
MGAFAWLASTALDHQISVRISHPAITEEICLSMAALLDRPDDKGLSVGSDRWHHLAGELSRQAAYRSNVNAEEDTSLEKQTENVDITDSLVRVVRDQDHLAVLTEYLQTAQDRLAISCTTMDEIALKRLHPLKYRKSPVANLKVFFSAPDPQSPKVGPILEMIRSMGGEAFYKPAMRLNALVMDTSVVFSSYRFLAGNVSGTARRGDIGLQIENSSFADTLWSFLNR